MNYLITFIAICFGTMTLGENPRSSHDAGKSCPPEVSTKLIEALSVIVGELGTEQIKVSQLLSRDIKETSEFKKLKTEYYKIKETKSTEYAMAFDEIRNLSAKHPECDKKFLLRLKNSRSAN